MNRTTLLMEQISRFNSKTTPWKNDAVEPHTCPRCGKNIDHGAYMSVFDTQMICPECRVAEKDHPGYKTANAQMFVQLLMGDPHFHGIGYIEPESYEKMNEIEVALINRTFIECAEFIGSGGFEKITIPEGVVHINSLAFAENYDVKEVVLPQSLRTMGNEVFRNCRNLEKINVNELENLITVGNDCFLGCEKLK